MWDQLNNLGDNPAVGIGGHVLHGGQGHSSHTYGLTLDFLLSAEIVLANGSHVRASHTQHPELFWALRGAGMSYGIVTSFTFRTVPAPEKNVLFYYGYIWNRTQAIDGWMAFQNYCAGRTEPIVPREMNIRVFVGQCDGVNLLFLFEGVYHGTLSDFDIAIQPLLDALDGIGGLDSVNAGAHSVGWLDSLLYANNNALYSNWGTGEGLEVPFNYTVYAKSLMTNDLSIVGVIVWLDRLYNTGPSNNLVTPSYCLSSSSPSLLLKRINLTLPQSWYLIISAQGGPTSLVSLVPPTSTSYAHRSQLFEWQFVTGVASSSSPFPIQQAYSFLTL
ncbi:hypothetical protein BOTCAL_0059g00320 [Botryotinia calthae]|uniref:FAD-binding PCMH-type domain-containing protein n=1 Tax=Botryotinia calthae TaxID=38488 RepID=A0A4Y8DCJ1_9HELO|nr:hypothetical protein BOTCAL_0059g00320 [Botryotinia calthae]